MGRYQIINTSIGYMVIDNETNKVVENYVCPRVRKYRDKVAEYLGWNKG
jgi:hypothetical protein